jgi:hypothetical protein
MSLTYQHAGTPINGVIETPLYEREGWDPLFPFKTLEQWQLARTMVEANMSKSSVDRLLRRNLVNPSAQVATVDQLRKILQQMPERDSMPVKWRNGRIQVDRVDMEFWYRDPMEAVRYILNHAPFREHLKYTPTTEINANGERTFSEMWTADWWHRKQVCVTSIQGISLAASVWHQVAAASAWQTDSSSCVSLADWQ